MMVVLLSITMLLSLVMVAFFAGVETGFLSVNRGRIIHITREGGRKAKVINESLTNLGRTMTALLIGGNLGSVIYSSASAALAALVVAGSPVAESVWSVCAAMALLVLGEFAPKLLCSARPLRWLLAFAPWWDVLGRFLSPVGAAVQAVIVRFMPRREPKTRITPDTVLKILEDRKDGVRLSDFESALVGRIMTLRARGEFVTPDSLLSALDHATRP